MAVNAAHSKRLIIKNIAQREFDNFIAQLNSSRSMKPAIPPAAAGIDDPQRNKEHGGESATNALMNAATPKNMFTFDYIQSICIDNAANELFVKFLGSILFVEGELSDANTVFEFSNGHARIK